MHLHLDLISGLAGDMMLGALVELGADAEEIVRQLRLLPLSEWRAEFVKRDVGHAIFGTGVVVVDLAHEHDHDHDHDHTHSHGHTHYSAIKSMIEQSSLTDSIKRRAIAIFEPIARAEARMHDTSIDDVAFHEVGAVDSIVDIVGCAIALDLLSVETLTATPVPLGRGFTHSQHGRIPVPAPATLAMLEGVPCVASGLTVELVTPTGAGILAGLVDDYLEMP